MLLPAPIDILWMSLLSLPFAAVALWAVGRPRTPSPRDLLRRHDGDMAFLFEGRVLRDATRTAKQVLQRADNDRPDLDCLVEVLRPSFPDIRSAIDGLGACRRTLLHSDREGSGGTVEIEKWGAFLRIVVRLDEDGSNHAEKITRTSMEEEIAVLRSLAEDAPQLIWKEAADGTITWANRAYLDLAWNGEEGAWPPDRLLPIAPPVDGRANLQRLRAELAGPVRWFDVTSLKRGRGSVHFGVSADQAVRGEAAQRDLIQSLTKTFGNLATGLAIFDRDRKLILFNPAFHDLTGLPVPFLAGKPDLASVFDRLRENRILPEPPNYAHWRARLAQFENEAADGTFCESWTLPDGEIYRVSGKPHPDGAIAFLFEDVSADISQLRRFRGELELTHSILESRKEAIAAFSDSGTLVFANQAYKDLWGRERESEDVPLADPRFTTELAHWIDGCHPSPIWPDLRAFVERRGEAETWEGRMTTASGRVLHCALRAMPAGATLVTFRADRRLPRIEPDNEPAPGPVTVAQA